jgi:uncharacterized protein (DUF1697 family)
MPTTIAFLRAINVGGRYIKMAALAEHFRGLGLAGVNTYINSGNVLFDDGGADLQALSAHIETGLETRLGFKSEVFLRPAAVLHRLSASLAVHQAALPSLGEVNVVFLSAPPNATQQAALSSLRSDVDEFVVQGTHIIWLCRCKQSDSKFSNAVLERKLGVRSTIRRATMLAKLTLQIRQGSGGA